MRVVTFVDGFNLYHAIRDLAKDHLKWIDLRALCRQFAPEPQFQLTSVYYFSAYATWRQGPYRRHREYVKALTATGVTPIMARFKEKDRSCFNCGHQWKDHEEKETDVGIAAHLVAAAFRNLYDRALLISNDSDLVPAIRLVRAGFPSKQLRIITPVGRRHSLDLVRAAGGLRYCARMKVIHVERSLLPRQVTDANGRVVATRPVEYDPP